MTRAENVTFPESFQHDIDRAVKILEEEGCSEIFLFGSGAAGTPGKHSDIDLAVRGCPRGQFFRVLGRLLLEIERPVDLVNLDTDDAFAQYLLHQGDLLRIG